MNFTKNLVLGTMSVFLSNYLCSAIEVELQNKNLLQVQKLSSQYKRERDAALLLPANPAHLDVALETSDTGILIKAAHDHNNAEYLAFAKAEIIKIVSPWVLSLTANGPNSKIVRRTVGGSMGKQDFIDDLEATIKAVASATIPADKKLATLLAAKNTINQEIADAVKSRIDTLLTANGAFLVHPIHGGCVNPPAGQGRDQFKAEIEARIKSF